MDVQSTFIEVKRPVYSVATFRNTFKTDNVEKSFYQNIKEYKFAQLFKSQKLKHFLSSFFPFWTILQSFYVKSFIVSDIIAGITTCIFHIPQGLAYGLLSGVKPINGLYTSFFPVIIYAFLGTSRHLSLGTFSLMSLMISEPVERSAANCYPKDVPQFINITSCFSNVTSDNCENQTTIVNPAYEAVFDLCRLQTAIVCTFLAGATQFLMGILNIGFISIYLPDPLIRGFTFSCAIFVLTSQLPLLVGYKFKRYSGAGSLFLTYIDGFTNIRRTHLPTVLTSLICIVILFLFKQFINPRFKKRFHFMIPIELLLLLGSTLISFVLKMNASFGVRIVGVIPKGLPLPLIPDFGLAPALISDSIAIGIVGFVISASLAKVYSLKFKYKCDYNQELRALGLANIFSSFFRCHISSGALARSSVVVDVGMKSQVASLISCFLMLIVLLWIGPLFESVPNCVLSALIVVSLKEMFLQVRALPALCRQSFIDGLIWLVVAIAVIIFDVTFGLLIGFVFCLLTLIYRARHSSGGLLGNLPGTDIYKRIDQCSMAESVPGFYIFSFDASPNFATIHHFQSQLYQKTINPIVVVEVNNSHQNEDKTNEAERSTLREAGEIKNIIIDCSTWLHIDSVATRVMKEIIESYEMKKINIFFANCRDDILERLSFINTNNCFISIHDAVLQPLPVIQSSEIITEKQTE